MIFQLDSTNLLNPIFTLVCSIIPSDKHNLFTSFRFRHIAIIKDRLILLSSSINSNEMSAMRTKIDTYYLVSFNGDIEKPQKPYLN